jgi:bifunctional non-homologous end joining protein LigD
VKTRAASPVRLPDFIEPMKAFSGPDLPNGNWIYETNFDGYRALAFKSGKKTRLVSRNQKGYWLDSNAV